jgi:hypothetical protein
MKRLDSELLTPIYVKQSRHDAWPGDAAFYAMTGDGVLLCRNERFFQSAVPARRPPCELAPQQSFLRVSFPPIPQHLVEQAVGFFDWAYQARGAESVLLVGWNDARRAVELIAPEQTARSWRNAQGIVYPDSVRYILPHPMPDGFDLFGDLHSHGDMSAYASATDQQDADQFNGLHLVAGRLDDEPPQWHLEATVDGARFAISRQLVFAGYRSRNPDFPAEWRERHRVEYWGHVEPVVPAATNQYRPGTPPSDGLFPGEA